jgi:hypothetical protein
MYKEFFFIQVCHIFSLSISRKKLSYFDRCSSVVFVIVIIMQKRRNAKNVTHYSNISKIINMKLVILAYHDKMQLLEKGHNIGVVALIYLRIFNRHALTPHAPRAHVASDIVVIILPCKLD